MIQAGFSVSDARDIKEEVNHYTNVMKAVKQASGEDIDLKQYDPFIRRNTYIGAKPVDKRTYLPKHPIIDPLIKKGAEGLDGLSEDIKNNKKLASDSIERNI